MCKIGSLWEVSAWCSDDRGVWGRGYGGERGGEREAQGEGIYV